MSHHDIEQIKRKNKLTNDEKYLFKYAEQRGVKNKVAYINAIKRNGGASEIIEQYREKERVSKYWNNQVVKTSKLIQEYKTFKAEEPTENFKALKSKLQAMCRQ